MIHREDQINTIASILAPALKEDMPTKEEKQLDLDKVKPTIANMIAAQKGFDVMEE